MPNLAQSRQFFAPCDLDFFHMTLKNNRARLLCHFKLCASFRRHLWIQTGVMVCKTQIGAKIALTSVTSTFDLWRRPFVWTLCLSMVITPENFRMIRSEEHGEKGVMDGRTAGRTAGQKCFYSCLVAAKNILREESCCLDVMPHY